MFRVFLNQPAAQHLGRAGFEDSCYDWIVSHSTPPPPAKYWSPNSWNLKMWSYVEIGLLHVELLTMRSRWSRVGPSSSITGVLTRKGKFGYRHREMTCDGGGRDGSATSTSQEHQGWPSATGGRTQAWKRLSPSSQKKPVLALPRFHISSL